MTHSNIAAERAVKSAARNRAMPCCTVTHGTQPVSRRGHGIAAINVVRRQGTKNVRRLIIVAHDFASLLVQETLGSAGVGVLVKEEESGSNPGGVECNNAGRRIYIR